ncbi:MAG: hypothetical protein V8T10_04000 [Merdibacter sp.]
MIKEIRMIPYHIRQAFKGMFRHLGMTLSAIVAVIITLLLLAIFLCAAGNVSLFAGNIEGGLQIHAYPGSGYRYGRGAGGSRQYPEGDRQCRGGDTVHQG